MSNIFISAASADPVYLTAQQRARSEIRPAVAGSVLPDACGTAVIELGPGDHVLSSPNALLGREGMTAKAVGLKLKGQGSAITTVVINANAPTALMSNEYWQGLTIEGIRFVAATPGHTGLAQYSSQSAQNVKLNDVVFEKFKRPIELIGKGGNNNNSEFSFHNCSDFSTQDDGAFLYIGSDGSDQFLNYMWSGIHRHWGGSAPLIDATKGGHFHIGHVDASNWGVNGGKLINLRGNAHGFGACSLNVDHLRVELMNADAGLLYSEWNYGTVDLKNVDVSSQVFRLTYGDIITIIAGNPGVKYTISNSQLAGFINLNATSPGGDVKVRDSYWLQQTDPRKGAGASQIALDNVTTWTTAGVKRLSTMATGGSTDMFTAEDRKLLTDARNASVNLAWEGHKQLGVTDGKHVGEDGKPIPQGKPLSYLDYSVQKFGPA